MRRSKYMAKAENLEPPREGLIRQEIISYEEDEKGKTAQFWNLF